MRTGIPAEKLFSMILLLSLLLWFGEAPGDSLQQQTESPFLQQQSTQATPADTTRAVSGSKTEKPSDTDNTKDHPRTLVVYPATGLWGDHELQARSPLVRDTRAQKKSYDWVTALIIFFFLALATVRFFFPFRFKENLTALWDQTSYSNVMKESGVFNNWAPFFLSLNFLFTTGLLVLQTLMYLDILSQSISFALFLVYAMGIGGLFYLIKYLVMRFISWVFQTQAASEAYFRNIFLANQFTGMVMLPLLTLNLFNPTPILLYTSWGILSLAAFYKLFRGFSIGMKLKGFSVYYLILYLCTIELAPFLFVVKYLTNHISL